MSRLYSLDDDDRHLLNSCLEACCHVAVSARPVVVVRSLRDVLRAIDLTTGRDRRSECTPGLSNRAAAGVAVGPELPTLAVAACLCSVKLFLAPQSTCGTES